MRFGIHNRHLETDALPTYPPFPELFERGVLPRDVEGVIRFHSMWLHFSFLRRVCHIFTFLLYTYNYIFLVPEAVVRRGTRQRRRRRRRRGRRNIFRWRWRRWRRRDHGSSLLLLTSLPCCKLVVSHQWKRKNEAGFVNSNAVLGFLLLDKTPPSVLIVRVFGFYLSCMRRK